MEGIDSLWEGIVKNPEDWDRYPILADAYEEMGDEQRAKGCRWCHKWKKRPYTNRPESFQWYDIEEAPVTDPIDPESDLPHDIFNELEAVGYKGVRRSKACMTFREAFEALFVTLSNKS